MPARPQISSARSRTTIPVLLSLVVLAAAGGCARERASDSSALNGVSAAARLLGAGSAADAARDAGGLQQRRSGPYPLAVGNRWEYEVTERITLIPNEGPVAIGLSQRPWFAEIVGTQRIELRDYFLQAEYDPRVAPPAPGPNFAMRQDRTGLYDRDLVTAGGAPMRLASDSDALRASVTSALEGSPQRESLQRASLQVSERLATLRQEAQGASLAGFGGPDPGEITLLRYPLFTGASWIVRHSPRFARRVIGRERVDLPAGTLTAWKLRGTSELFGPRDQVHFWYARAGLVRVLVRTESPATDVNGSVTGRVIGEWDQSLTRATLLDPDSPRTYATTGEGEVGR